MRPKLSSSALLITLLAAALAAGCRSDTRSDANAANANAAQPSATAASSSAATTAQPAASPAAPAPPGAAATGGAPPAPAQTSGGAPAANAASGGAASASAASAPKPSDACALLTADEIREVQGEAVRSMKPSERAEPNFRVAQCFYTTPTFTKSVSLEVTRRGGGTQSVREMWKQNFARYEEKRTAKNERRKKAGKPLAGEAAVPFKGVGDEAYWVGTNANGTLYAFKGDSLLRLSIGGAEDNETRQRKLKALAQKALARL